MAIKTWVKSKHRKKIKHQQKQKKSRHWREE